MKIVDERGRLFGRINLIDAICLTFVLLLVPLAYTSWFLFRMPAPKVIEVTPQVFVVNAPVRLSIRGEHLRPYMKARVGLTMAEFYIENPTTAMVKAPPLPVGTYDLTLLDEAQVLLTLLQAVTVVEPRAQLPPQPPRATAEYKICLAVQLSPRVAALARKETTLHKITDRHVTARMDLLEANDGGLSYETQRVRIDEPLTIEYPLFIIRGVVTCIDRVKSSRGVLSR